MSAGLWEPIRARYLFRERRDRAEGTEALLAATQDLGVVLRSRLTYEVVNPTESVETYKQVVPGDFVISLRSFQGGLELAHDRGIISPAYTVLRPLDPSLSPWYAVYFKSAGFISQLQANAVGIRQGKTIGWAEFRDLLIPVPRTPVQIGTVHWLVEENEKVGRLAAGLVNIRSRSTLRDFAMLLHEYRDALVHEACLGRFDRVAVGESA